MSEMVRFASVRATRILIGGTIAALMYLLFLTFGPTIESKFFPVVRFEDVVQQRNGRTIRIDTTFDKLRACEYIDSQWYVKNKSDRFIDVMAATVNYHNATQGFTRPVGQNYDRDWEVTLPDAHEEFRSIFMVINYKCGWPWVTQAIVGPYKLAGAKDAVATPK